MREFLHLPQEIVPATLKRPVRTETARAKPKGQSSDDIGVLYDRCLFVQGSQRVWEVRRIATGVLTEKDHQSLRRKVELGQIFNQNL